MSFLLLLLQAAAQDPAAWNNCRIERDLQHPDKPVVKVSFGCHSDLTDAGLARLKEFTELRELHLLSDKVTDAGLEHLKAFPELESLHLNSSALGDKALEHLAALPRLRELMLFRVKVTSEGLALLKKQPKLRRLLLIRVAVDAEAVEQLKHLDLLESLHFEQLKPESQAKAAELIPLLPRTRISFSR